MRKFSWLIAIFAILALAFVGFVSCGDPEPEDEVPDLDLDELPFVPGEGGQVTYAAPLYNAGTWSASTGERFLFSFLGDSFDDPDEVKELVTSNNRLRSAGDDFSISALFENQLNLADFDFMIITTTKASLRYWFGGDFYFVDDDDEFWVASWYEMYEDESTHGGYLDSDDEVTHPDFVGWSEDDDDEVITVRFFFNDYSPEDDWDINASAIPWGNVVGFTVKGDLMTITKIDFGTN